MAHHFTRLHQLLTLILFVLLNLDYINFGITIQLCLTGEHILQEP